MMTISTPYVGLLPPLTSGEFDALSASIAADGLREPILIDEAGNILDGHHRYRIRPDAPTRVIEGLSEAGKKAFVIACNLRRRNLSPDQKEALRDQQKVIAAELKAEGQTQEQIATALGVARETVRNWLTPISNGQSANANTDLPDARVKLSKTAKAKVVDRVNAGESQEQIAADFGVSQPRVSQIANAEKQRLVNEALKAKARAIQAAAGRYGTIIIDPPWQIQKIERELFPNQEGFDYPTMTEAELAAFDPMKSYPADDCHLFCWTTQRFLPAALRLVEVWGFTYCLTMVWHKNGGFQPFGLPQYNCEFVVYARRGSPKFASTKQFFCCFNGDRREHSRKPENFYDTIRNVTDGRRVDIFSREQREGFDQYGNEIAKFEVPA